MRSNWQRVRELFERALEEQPSDLDAWLAREAAADSVDVRAEVRSLLEHDSRAGRFLTQPVAERVPLLLDEEPSYPEGHVVGHYTIRRELGRGGMGRVYLATDGRLNRPVALKAVAPRLTSDPSHRERLRREARAAAALTHPGICTVYALEEHDGELFIAAEYVEGHTLREEIDSGRRPSVTEIARTARDIAAALAGAHSHGITHRDLKPENVMRTLDGGVKLLDFGLARTELRTAGASMGQLTQPGVLVGTPGYMAPEQLNGDRGDARVDLFAFGVMLYEYACGGVHPFAAPTPLSVAARILQTDAAPLQSLCPGLPVSVAAVIERCLQKAPAERYASAVEMAAALTAREFAPAQPVLRWWRTHQVIVIALYFVASAVAWKTKESQTGAPLVIFGVIGVAATIAGVFRGHLLFTERMNAKALRTERRQADQATLIVDVLIGAALLVDAALMADNPVPAVLTVALGLGVVLARVVVERSTAQAAFGE